MKILLIAVISFFVISCKNQLAEQTYKQTDSLLNVVKNVKLKFKSTDTTTYANLYNKVKSTNKIFKKLAINLPKDTSFTNQFAEYTMLQKDFKRFFIEYSKIDKELTFAETQLQNLKCDLKNKSIKENEKIKQYFNDESMAVNKLQTRIYDIFFNADIYKKAYLRVSAKIETFAENLKNQKK